jgi:hypothetical protein
VAKAILLGGACDQQTRTFTSDPPPDTITCKGQGYHLLLGPPEQRFYIRDGWSMVTLKGAPCDGRNLGITRTALAKGSLTCQGHLYVNATGAQGSGPYGQAVWWEAKLLEQSAVPSSAPTHVSTAWTHWMRTLAHKGPKAHNRIRNATARARRIAR